jgi:hypothetical protein
MRALQWPFASPFALRDFAYLLRYPQAVLQNAVVLIVIRVPQRLVRWRYETGIELVKLGGSVLEMRHARGSTAINMGLTVLSRRYKVRAVGHCPLC